jgi:hypothetical protein
MSIVRVRITDIRDHTVQELDLSLNSRDMTGWQSGVLGWSIGQKESGAPIQINEPPGEYRVGVFVFTFQVLLWGIGNELPEVWSFPQDTPTRGLVPFNPERWLRLHPEELKRVAMGGDIRIRFDQSPLRFGNYIFESLKVVEPANCCAFCNERLQSYFRVGSQQACPACTEKFKEEMRTNLARNYRRALLIGIATAIVGAAIHSLLIGATGVSVGSLLTGVLVGFAMRIASRESAGVRYRVTAALLTFVAGSFPLLPVQTILPVVYLAIGVFAAWTIAARNVRTEIHGPFQSKPA